MSTYHHPWLFLNCPWLSLTYHTALISCYIEQLNSQLKLCHLSASWSLQSSFLQACMPFSNGEETSALFSVWNVSCLHCWRACMLEGMATQGPFPSGPRSLEKPCTYPEPLPFPLLRPGVINLSLGSNQKLLELSAYLWGVTRNLNLPLDRFIHLTLCLHITI